MNLEQFNKVIEEIKEWFNGTEHSQEWTLRINLDREELLNPLDIADGYAPGLKTDWLNAQKNEELKQGLIDLISEFDFSLTDDERDEGAWLEGYFGDITVSCIY